MWHWPHVVGSRASATDALCRAWQLVHVPNEPSSLGLPIAWQALQPLATALGSGAKRRDYLRARLDCGALTVFDGQDSGRTVPLVEANTLVIREIGAPARPAGEQADYIAIA